MAGTKAWSVFGTVELKGMGGTMRQLTAFNSAGALLGKNMRGWHRNSLILAGGFSAVGLAVGALGVSSVRNFASFDAAMTQSLAIMGNVEEGMRDDMAQAARDMARQTIFSAEQAAESYFFLASAGLNAEQSIAALPQVAKFAQAGMFDMALATDLATDAQSALGLTVDDAAQNLRNMTRVTDVLVKANTLANATVEQFSTALTTDAGAAAKAYGVELEETVAVLAAYADQGIKAEKAGSSFGRLLRLLIPAANNNADAFERLNIQVFDSEGNLRNLADILGDMEEAFKDLSPRQLSATLEMLGFLKRTQQVILPLIGTSDAVREYETALHGAAGITEEVADRQLETLSHQFGLLKSEIQDVTFSLGEFLVESTALEFHVKFARVFLADMRTGFGLWADEVDNVKTSTTELNRQLLSMRGTTQTTLGLIMGFTEPYGPPDLRGRGGGPTGGPMSLQEMVEGLVGRGAAKDIFGGRISRLGIDTSRGLPGHGPGLTGWHGLDPLIGSTAFSRAIVPEDLSATLAPMTDMHTEQLAAYLQNVIEDTRTNEAVVSAFESLGVSLVQGLVNGTFSMKDFVVNSLISFALGPVLGSLGTALGIGSPSRVTKQMGRDLVIGLESGIVETAMNTTPGSNMFDLSKMPAPTNPLAMHRDKDWQEFFRRSGDAAAHDGHVPGRK